MVEVARSVRVIARLKRVLLNWSLKYRLTYLIQAHFYCSLQRKNRKLHLATKMQSSSGLDSSGDRRQDSCNGDWLQARISMDSGSLALVWNAILIAEYIW